MAQTADEVFLQACFDYLLANKVVCGVEVDDAGDQWIRFVSNGQSLTRI